MQESYFEKSHISSTSESRRNGVQKTLRQAGAERMGASRLDAR